MINLNDHNHDTRSDLLCQKHPAQAFIILPITLFVGEKYTQLCF